MQALIDLRHVHDQTTLANYPMHFLVHRQTEGQEKGVKGAISVFSIAHTVLPHDKRADDESIIFGFVDPCALPTHPGWPLRNFLAWIQRHFPLLVYYLKYYVSTVLFA
jgi:ubiquitin-like modifier-activating enzyme ATG7